MLTKSTKHVKTMLGTVLYMVVLSYRLLWVIIIVYITSIQRIFVLTQLYNNRVTKAMLCRTMSSSEGVTELILWPCSPATHSI